MADVLGSQDIEAAQALAALLRSGQQPEQITTPLDDMLDLHEHAFWRLDVGVWLYCSDPTARYVHYEAEFKGSVGWYLFNKAFNAARNKAGRERMDAQGRPQWRYQGTYVLVLTTHQLILVDVGGGVLVGDGARRADAPVDTIAWQFRNTSGFSIEDRAVLVGIDGGPLKLVTHAPHWLYVALTWLRTGRVAQGY